MITISGPTLVVLFAIAALCGTIGRALVGNVRTGVVTSIALGFIGALLGTWLARQLRLPEPLLIHVGGRPFPILWSILGSALAVAILQFSLRRRALLKI